MRDCDAAVLAFKIARSTFSTDMRTSRSEIMNVIFVNGL